VTPPESGQAGEPIRWICPEAVDGQQGDGSTSRGLVGHDCDGKQQNHDVYVAAEEEMAQDRCGQKQCKCQYLQVFLHFARLPKGTFLLIVPNGRAKLCVES
jgi:hypothetical protein